MTTEENLLLQSYRLFDRLIGIISFDFGVENLDEQDLLLFNEANNFLEKLDAHFKSSSVYGV